MGLFPPHPSSFPPLLQNRFLHALLHDHGRDTGYPRYQCAAASLHAKIDLLCVAGLFLLSRAKYAEFFGESTSGIFLSCVLLGLFLCSTCICITQVTVTQQKSHDWNFLLLCLSFFAYILFDQLSLHVVMCLDNKHHPAPCNPGGMHFYDSFLSGPVAQGSCSHECGLSVCLCFICVCFGDPSS